MNISFNFTLVNTREWDCCICGDSMFNFIKKTKQNKTAKLFSRVVYCCALASNKVWECMKEFSCSLFSPALGIVRLFQFNYSNRCFVVSHYGFNLYFPMMNDVKQLFIAYLLSTPLLWWSKYFIGLVFFLIIFFECGVLYILIRYMICKYFLPI